MTTTTVKAGYKMTDIGVIPEDWEIKTFGEAFSFLSTATYSRDVLSEDDEVKYVHYGDIHTKWDNFLDFRKGILPTISGEKVKNYSLLKDGDVIMADASEDYAGIGKSVEVKNLNYIKAISGLHTFLLRDRGIFVDGFRGYIHENKSVKTQFDRLATGLKVYGVSKNNLKIVQIPVPSQSEQQAIANVLSDTDELISSLEALIAKKRRIKEGAMQELLTGKKRLAGFSGKWRVEKIRDLASICRGASPRPIDSPIWFNDKSQVGWVRISDVSCSNKYLKRTTQFLSELGIKHSRFIEKGNLIMSICATVGRPILIQLDVCIHDGFVVFGRPKIDKEYLYYYLSFIEKDWAKNGQTGSQMNLNTDLINNTEIQLPSTQQEQQAIAQILSDMDSEITTLEAKRDKYKLVKQGLMQVLLTGKIRLIQK